MTAPKKLTGAVGSRTAPYASRLAWFTESGAGGLGDAAPVAWTRLPWSFIETVGKPQAGESPLSRALRRLPSCVPLIPRGPFAAVSFPWRPEDERTCLTIFHNCLRGARGSLPLQAGVGGVTREEPASGCALKGDREAAAASGNRAGRRRVEEGDARRLSLGAALARPNLVEQGQF